ncbi:hypothetical protein Tco_0881544 [Tanacetum coccineum]
MTARISIRDEPSISLPPREEIPSTPPDSPTHIEIPKSCLPLWNRVRFASPTPSQEVWESSAAGAARQDRPTLAREDLYGFVDMVDIPSRCSTSRELDYGITDTWDDLVGAIDEIAPTTLEGVNQRITNFSTVVEQEPTIMYGVMEDARDYRKCRNLLLHTHQYPRTIQTSVHQESMDHLLCHRPIALHKASNVVHHHQHIPGPDFHHHPDSYLGPRGTTITGLRNLPRGPEQAPPSPGYLPYPLHDAASPTAESPGYIPESDPEEDPEEDPADYPADRDDDDDDDNDEDEDEDEEEEEKHPAPADSVLPIHQLDYGITDTWDDLVGAIDEIAPTTLEGVNQRITNFSTVVEQEPTIMYGVMEDARDYRKCHIIMSDSEHSTVTYTSVSEDDSDIGSPGVDGPPIMPEDPYAYIMASYGVPPSPDYIPGPEVPPSPDYIPGPEGPPSPDYVPGPEEPEQAPPSPGYLPYVPEPVYLEYIPPADDVFLAEEQPLHDAASPTAESPGYIPESDPEEDPEEDPADYPADRDDDDDDDNDEDEDEDEEEEEKHPAPADSVLPIHRITTRISIRDEPSISLPPREEIPSTPPDSPTHIEIPKSCLPLWKRVRFASPTPSQEVGESSAAGAARQDRPTLAREDLYGFVDMVDIPPRCLTSRELDYGIAVENRLAHLGSFYR